LGARIGLIVASVFFSAELAIQYKGSKKSTLARISPMRAPKFFGNLKLRQGRGVGWLAIARGGASLTCGATAIKSPRNEPSTWTSA